MDFDTLKEVLAALERHGVRMKRDTVRPKDWADAAWLKQRFGLDDE